MNRKRLTPQTTGQHFAPGCVQRVQDTIGLVLKDTLAEDLSMVDTDLTNFQQGHEQIVFCNDQATGLRAIIAIHDTTLGPALGGCRFRDYQDQDEALIDVLKLSKGMTYKAAIAGLPLGGGKSVILGDPEQLKSESFFRAFGRFVNSLGGRYITAEDVNIRVEDMNQVAMETNYVTGITVKNGGSGDPAPVTAWGVFSGIRAAVAARLEKENLSGLRVAVQGCGSVGKYLSRYLHRAGARLIISDISEKNLSAVRAETGATIVPHEQIFSQDVDIFAPCALGGILNDETIPKIKAPVIAGGANNQLLDENRHMDMLTERKILYAPDYVINAGGLINVWHELRGYAAKKAKKDAAGIFTTLKNIFKDAEKTGWNTHQAANHLAESRIAHVRKTGRPGISQTLANQDWIRIRS